VKIKLEFHRKLLLPLKTPENRPGDESEAIQGQHLHQIEIDIAPT